jgi:lipopolysaccharide transport system ATP-binding protein
MSTAISVENISKVYRLGEIGGRTIQSDFARWCAKLQGKPDPTLKIGQEHHARLMGQQFWALEDVSFDVKQGEVLGIIGRNGAGKSTLLKILSQVTTPSSGEIKIKGRIASLLEVGTGFHPELTGRENVFLNGAILGMTKAEIRGKFDEIVAFSEIEEFIDTPVKRYSSGMYVRLAFAVAAHLEPEILIVDEVLAVGDAAFQSKCIGKMQSVSKDGRTVIFVSHTMSAVAQLCDRGILFRKGKVALDDEASKVINAYLGDASVSDNGEFDLSKHPSRSAQSEAIIRKIRLCNANGISVTSLVPDEPCTVQLDYELKEPIKQARLAIAVEDYQGRRIMTFASYFHDNKISELSGRGTVQCAIDSLGLGTGRYLLSVSISDKTRGMLDSLDNAAWFEIGWNNNYQNGEPYGPVYGPVIRESKWEILAGN